MIGLVVFIGNPTVDGEKGQKERQMSRKKRGRVGGTGRAGIINGISGNGIKAEEPLSKRIR